MTELCVSARIEDKVAIHSFLTVISLSVYPRRNSAIEWFCRSNRVISASSIYSIYIRIELECLVSVLIGTTYNWRVCDSILTRVRPERRDFNGWLQRTLNRPSMLYTFFIAIIR